MNIKTFYKRVGGDFDDVLARMINQELIIKFVLKFIEDKTFNDLCNAFDNNDIKEAFFASHTLKGICMRLGFGRLYKSSNLLTESLRKNINNLEPSIKYFDKVSNDYKLTISLLQQLDNSVAQQSQTK